MGEDRRGFTPARYILRRGLRLYFRLSIPRDLLRFFDGRLELRRSLKATCYSDARTLVRFELFRAERLFVRLRGGFMTSEEIRKMVGAYFESAIVDAEDARADGSGVLSGERMKVPLTLRTPCRETGPVCASRGTLHGWDSQARKARKSTCSATIVRWVSGRISLPPRARSRRRFLLDTQSSTRRCAITTGTTLAIETSMLG